VVSRSSEGRWPLRVLGRARRGGRFFLVFLVSLRIFLGGGTRRNRRRGNRIVNHRSDRDRNWHRDLRRRVIGNGRRTRRGNGGTSRGRRRDGFSFVVVVFLLWLLFALDIIQPRLRLRHRNRRQDVADRRGWGRDVAPLLVVFLLVVRVGDRAPNGRRSRGDRDGSNRLGIGGDVDRDDRNGGHGALGRLIVSLILNELRLVLIISHRLERDARHSGASSAGRAGTELLLELVLIIIGHGLERDTSDSGAGGTVRPGAELLLELALFSLLRRLGERILARRELRGRLDRAVGKHALKG
jgi:hypothetical protein